MKEKIVLILFTILLALSLKAEINKDSLFIALNTIKLDHKGILKTFAKKIVEEEQHLSEAQFLELNQKGLKVSKEIAFDTLYFQYLENICTYYLGKGAPIKEQKYIEIGLAHALEINDNNQIISHYSSLGGNFLQQKKFIAGINYLLKAADYAIRHEGKNKAIEKIQYVAYLNLGFAFNHIGEIEEANKYCEKAKKYFKANNNLSPLATTYQFMANNYDELENRDSADLYIYKASKLIKELLRDSAYNDEIHNLTYNLSNVVAYYMESNNVDSSKVYYTELAKLNLGNEDYKYILDLNYALIVKDLTKAKTLIGTAPKALSPIFSRRHNQLKAIYYETIGNYQESLIHYKHYADIVKEDSENHRIKWIDFTDAKLNMFQQQKDIIELEAKQHYQSQLLRLFIGIALLTLIILFLAAYAYFQTRKNLENSKALEKQAKIIQQAEYQKNDFLNNVAHELQTPLSIILGLSKQKIKDLQNVKDILHIIFRNTNYLSDSVNQMLSINKFNEKQQYKPQKDLFRLTHFFQFLMPEYYFLANQKDITIIGPDLDANPDLIIYTDLDKLAVILKNLLSNAIKYTPRAGQVQLIYTRDNDAFHFFEVKDNGRGISDSERIHIFERNFQSARHETQGGFGLGLAICRKYVNLLSGKIDFESQEGKGTTFVVKIPKLSKAELLKLSTKQSFYKFPAIKLPSQVSLTKAKVLDASNPQLLIVEDNLDFCKYLEILLETSYSLTFVHSGNEAIQYLTDHQPDLMITDWMMEGKDGLDLVEQIRISDDNLPILMLTARSLISDQIKALSRGVNEYLLKPVNEAKLLSKIKRLLEVTPENENHNSYIIYRDAKNKALQFNKKDKEWILQVENAIQLNLQNFDFKVTDLAAEMQISLSQLSSKIKSLMGMTSKNFIQEVRYWEARRLLEEKRIKSVKALSLTIGFKDIKNFSRNFKKRFGKYPNEYIDN